MNLIEGILAAEVRESDEACKDYLALLEADEPKPAEVQKIRAAMARLGKQVHSIPEDRLAVAEMRRLRKSIADRSELPHQLQQIEQQEAASCAERDRKIAPHVATCVAKNWVQCDQALTQIKELSAPHEKVKQEAEELRGRAQAHETDKGALRRLEDRHQQLARHVK